MKPSRYQQDIFDWIRDGRGDAAVNAVAGSGKTTTLVEASRLLRTDRALFLAFNKHIVAELQSRLSAGVQCKTLNSLGFGAVARSLGTDKKIRLDDGKYRDIAKTLVASHLVLRSEQAHEATRAVVQLVSFAQSTLSATDDEALANVADRFGIDSAQGLADDLWFELVRLTLEQGEQFARMGIISFDDQIWLPAKWNLRPMQADWVLVDECQDLSAAKLELALSARAPGGRMLFVGDPRQAIYGFAGADPNSFAHILKRTGALELPLSVSYRCPTSVVALAQRIVPQIEAAPGAAAGTVAHVPVGGLCTSLRTGDLVLCRLTAPLISLCVQLIAKRIPARVKGRDLGRSLVTIARDALGRQPYADLEEMLGVYLDHKSSLLAQRKNGDSLIQSLTDRVNGVRACVHAFPEATSIESLAQSIDTLFTDGVSAVELSTVHRSKGLEAERVFILEPDKLPLVWRDQQPWEAVQEMNLKYVALTRSLRELFFVVDAPAAAEKPPAIQQELVHA